MKSIKFFRGSGGIELDLRKELNRTLTGAPDEVSKGALAVLRRMRRKAGVVYPSLSTELEPCSCRTNGFENEPDKDYECNICEGEGYLFDDEIVVLYKTNRYEYQDVEKYKAWGKHTVAMSFFFVEYFESITRFDKILEVKHNLEGEILRPVQLLHRHNVHMAEEFRADSGRTEYWRLSCWTD